MYGCESWNVKKAEGRRIDAFELWCWRRLLIVLWTARRSNQSIIKEISPGCSLEGPMLELKLQFFGHLLRRIESLEKTVMLGGIRDIRRRGRQVEMAAWHHQVDAREFEWTPGVGDGQGGLVCYDSWDHKELDMTEWLNWTERLHFTSLHMGVSGSTGASPVAQMLNNLTPMQETRVWSLGQEDPLEKGVPTHSSIFAWRIPWTKEPCGLQSMGLQRVGHNWVTNTFALSEHWIW